MMHYMCGHHERLKDLAYYRYGSLNHEVNSELLFKLNPFLDYANGIDMLVPYQAIFLPDCPNDHNVMLHLPYWQRIRHLINEGCSYEERKLIRDICQINIHPFVFLQIMKSVQCDHPSIFYFFAEPHKKFNKAITPINDVINHYVTVTSKLSEETKEAYASEHILPAYDTLQEVFDEALELLDIYRTEHLPYDIGTINGFNTDLPTEIHYLPDVLERVSFINHDTYALNLNIDPIANNENLPCRDEIEFIIAQCASRYLSKERLTPVLMFTRKGWVAVVVGCSTPFSRKHARGPFIVELVKSEAYRYKEIGTDFIYGNARAKIFAVAQVAFEVLSIFAGGWAIKEVAKVASPLALKLIGTVAKAIKKIPKSEGIAAESTALRQQVLSNIAKSKAGRTDTNRINFTNFTRRSTAIEFYSKNGFTAEETLAHMRGIDFNYPVEVIELVKGTPVIQYKLPNTPIGNYFASPGTSGSQLGIYTSGRSSVDFYANKNVKVLQSTASAMVDDYSMARYGWKIKTDGGGTQYFSPSKSMWERR